MAIKGKLIVVEGIIDTQIADMVSQLSDWLRLTCSRNIKVLDGIRGTELGNWVKHTITYTPTLHSSQSRLLMLLLAQQELIDKVIVPELEKGTWLVVNRYYYSTLAHQGHGDNQLALTWNIVSEFNWPIPDLVLYLDNPWEDHKRYLETKQCTKKGRYTLGGYGKLADNHISWWRRVHNGYDKLIGDLDEMQAVDMTLSEKEVLDEACMLVVGKLGDDFD